MEAEPFDISSLCALRVSIRLDFETHSSWSMKKARGFLLGLRVQKIVSSELLLRQSFFFFFASTFDNFRLDAARHLAVTFEFHAETAFALRH